MALLCLNSNQCQIIDLGCKNGLGCAAALPMLDYKECLTYWGSWRIDDLTACLNKAAVDGAECPCCMMMQRGRGLGAGPVQALVTSSSWSQTTSLSEVAVCSCRLRPGA